ncbi:F-box domain-containing protein [Emericellopsis atlantica]|uniref:F-box domain-containing protein n=1 Tax=Emericellopsis atlantica TaxID=2614577 RepID=A0A9P7ZF56_9HYPO|nr:F-box domain-containing protein [Emericellopsis atlantica]KAG9250973.1 F-box domain-containing protein [Emericellopsis atlantica]
MSPIINSCILCGSYIGDSGEPDPSWEGLFRICEAPFDSSLTVTGVGFANNPGAAHLVAPLDFGARWDTSDSRVSIDVIWQQSSLLEQACSPKQIPHRRLFKVYRSLTYSNRMGCVTWDHGFGGLFSEYLFVDQELTFASSNPFHMPEIQQLLHESPTSLDISRMISTGTNIFAHFPLEIITSISLHLPTSDYLSARLALRSFYPASRFLPGAERSWVFKSQDWDVACDWLWLYRRTVNGSPGIKNRERVWRLAKEVLEILSLEWIKPISFPKNDIDNVDWLEAAADVRSVRERPCLGFGGGCRRFHERQAIIPLDQLSHLAFSLIQNRGATYITGITFHPNQGQPICLGYMSETQRILDIKYLSGFRLAIRSRGIQGIRCILDHDRDSPWIGCPENAPQTERLLLSDPITGIKAGFDGYKMVSLAVTSRLTPGHGNLRGSAFWYPRVPEPGLCLNENSFTARENAMNRYEPICWTMFGGPAGTYLHMLTGISVTIDIGCPRTIEFHYNSDNVPPECRKVGRYTASDYAETMYFEIDGPGREVLDSLTVCIRQHPNHFR